MADFYETCCEYIKGERMYVSSTEKRIINNIHKWKEEHPEEVTIIAEPEKNGGCIYATVPIGYLSLKPKKKRNLSDEERLRRAEVARKAREKRYKVNREDE